MQWSKIGMLFIVSGGAVAFFLKQQTIGGILLAIGIVCIAILAEDKKPVTFPEKKDEPTEEYRFVRVGNQMRLLDAEGNVIEVKQLDADQIKQLNKGKK